MGAGKKKGSIPFPELPKKWAAFRSPDGTGNPAQAQRPGGVGKASEPPHFLESSRCLAKKLHRGSRRT